MNTDAATLHQHEGVHKGNRGLLAVAMAALEDFSPAFIPDEPASVMACCPVCIGEPGAVGALRVGVVGNPKRLSWHCSLHRGGFSGVRYALSKHQAAKVSDLALTEIPPSTKSDIEPEVDPVPDHQKEYRCENQRRILHHVKDLGHLTAMPVRCRHCVGCVSWLKAKRVSKLIDASSGWDSVHMVTGLGATAYASLSRRIRRHGAEYVAIPVEDGRTLLTSDTTVGGERIEPGACMRRSYGSWATWPRGGLAVRSRQSVSHGKKATYLVSASV